MRHQPECEQVIVCPAANFGGHPFRLTSSSQGSICRLGIGGLQAPQQQVEAPLRQAPLAAIEGLQPRLILRVQVILYEALVIVAHAACNKDKRFEIASERCRLLQKAGGAIMAAAAGLMRCQPITSKSLRPGHAQQDVGQWSQCPLCPRSCRPLHA